MATALEKVAAQLPDTNFAIVDYSQADMKTKPKNVRGLLFKEQEAGYLVGYLAGLLTKDEAGREQVIGSVGGQKIPPVDRYIAGYQAGAKKANPGITTLNGYSQDFVDQAKCKELALDQIARGAHVDLPGRGPVRARRARRPRRRRTSAGIGVDADQAFLGEHVADERLEEGRPGRLPDGAGVVDGGFKGGEDTIFDVAAGGVGIGEFSPTVPRTAVAEVKRVQTEITDGTVTTSRRPSQASSVRGSRPGRRIAADGRAACSRAPRDHEAVPRRRRERPASTSTCARARCTRCWARTAPASRR